ncbi:hypothetical protein L602_000100001950 [Cupriavidus gilardii J11]|uniref:Uncharacterized protein n=1 Tax=Cupriavidus gilardii J11 TaxID=936133 RepID=A0A562BVP3_9BURK|nr:hypothetical protein [Cupriavidus gilardii]TWG89305.1 hypothetical protein L602_000100001950 [Cupriavidus gilardii J11]
MTEPLQSLYAQLADLKRRVPALKARVAGRKYVESVRQAKENDRNHSAPRWVHFAHRGTLEKIEDLLPPPGPHETFELLATARNLFENLVWLRLMKTDIGYGLVFYGHLLRGQRANCEGYLAKMHDEADLFDTAARIDAEIRQELTGAIRSHGQADANRDVWREEIHRRTAMLDDLIRREFVLYAERAAHNGYGPQASILRHDAIPRGQQQLDQVLAFQAAFEAALPALLEPRLQNLATSEWNWSDRASEAGMDRHYRFIDSLTSRLLHATPINLITDKRLAGEEKRVVLDYIVVATADILDIVDEFSYPGMVDLVEVDIE